MVDAKVLQAQQWVNATYGTVAGYVKCPEDGKTAWSVMYSLTMGLQHELGITALSANFGPATLAALGSGIPVSTPNQNLVRIIQSGCFCKGYNAGDIDGNFGITTQGAVDSMMVNAGLTDGLGAVVTPKVMKAVLSMDAYVVIAGGSDDVRTIQQWLNGRYINRRDFFISPCDGLFSRGVETAMIYAIQYELGMADGVATGAFGPATLAGLRQHTVKNGDSGVWVSLCTRSECGRAGSSTSPAARAPTSYLRTRPTSGAGFRWPTPAGTWMAPPRPSWCRPTSTPPSSPAWQAPRSASRWSSGRQCVKSTTRERVTRMSDHRPVSRRRLLSYGLGAAGGVLLASGLTQADLSGYSANRSIAAAFESNYLSGTALALRPNFYSLGVKNGLFPRDVVIIRDILADCEGVVKWGGDLDPAKESHFQIDVAPNEGKLAAVANKITRWQQLPGQGAGSAVDPFSPNRLRAAQALIQQAHR